MSYKNAYKAPLVTKKMHLIYILLNKNKLFTACASAYIQMKGPDITRCTWAQDYLYIYIYIYTFLMSCILLFTPGSKTKMYRFKELWLYKYRQLYIVRHSLLHSLSHPSVWRIPMPIIGKIISICSIYYSKWQQNYTIIVEYLPPGAF